MPCLVLLHRLLLRKVQIPTSFPHQGFLFSDQEEGIAEQEMQAINTLVARNVSGIIVISPNTKNISESFYQELVQRVPLVFINGYHRIKGVSYVGNDEKMGSQMALAYLSGLGRVLTRGASPSDTLTGFLRD